MLISQVIFRGRFNDGAVGTVGFAIMVLTAWGFSRYTKEASKRDTTSKKKRLKKRRKRYSEEEDAYENEDHVEDTKEN